MNMHVDFYMCIYVYIYMYRYMYIFIYAGYVICLFFWGVPDEDAFILRDR